ncbi:hypothetical protein COF59_13710 [Bacillus pseudomycoides]|uniref:hypothetical protein n=1 Tax=Bacillus pseudomycoides TaxID=64104 RepID=UPI000BFEA398|nr:hypothetical protein [Bacillus pseudomycoides]PHE13626.1 hypothetical protein COF59_13710 [Bacillus pseudomycoides]
MTMKNFWDPPQPKDFTEVTEKRKFVSLHIYILPGLTRDPSLDDKIKKQVIRASDIWCTQCKIEVFASTIQELTENNPGDLIFNPELIKTDQIPGQVVHSLQDSTVYRPGCDDTEIAVYYIMGQRFQNAAAFSMYFLSATPRPLIFMTQQASGELLAHEIGHHLFVREEPIGSGNFVSTNPDPQGVYDPNDPTITFDPVNGHDKRQDFLMHGVVNGTKISPIQCAIINRTSKLVKVDNCLTSFNPPSGVLRRCTVEFKKMHVFNVSDEICSDPHLESTWSFKVWRRNKVTLQQDLIKDQPWVESNLFGPKDFDLTWLEKVTVDITDLNQEIVIDLTGSDEDSCSGNDALAVVVEQWGQTDDWGNGPHEPSSENDEIHYQLFYNIKTELLQPIQFPARECKAIVP